MFEAGGPGKGNGDRHGVIGTRIRVIAAVWVLKSERVLISESIEATPINHAMYVRAHIHARGLFFSVQH